MSEEVKKNQSNKPNSTPKATVVSPTVAKSNPKPNTTKPSQKKIDLNQKLSEHFVLWEFVTSQIAQRQGIDNTPSDQVIHCLKMLCDTILEPARFALGPLRISSGYRCPVLNKAVGGSDSSAHVLGFAADVIPLKVTKMEFAKWVIKNVPFDQVILEYGTINDPAWIHVSADPKARKQVLKILKGTGYQKVVI